MYTYLTAVVLYIISVAIPYNATANMAWEEKTDAISMSGCAAYYSKGLMPSVAERLGYKEEGVRYKDWLSENGYIGAVAVYRLGDRERDVHILWPNGVVDGPYYAIDVVARRHYELGLSKNRVIDVDHQTAQRHNIRGPMAVTIIYDNTPLFSILYGGDNSFETNITTDEYGDCLAYSRGRNE